MTTTVTEPMLGSTLRFGHGKRDRFSFRRSFRLGHSPTVSRSRRRTEERAWRREEGV